MSDDCPDCPPHDGRCDWSACGFDADYRLNEVTVRHKGALIHVGDVYLCGGHYTRLQRLGHLELDWEKVIHPAIVRQEDAA